VPLQEHKIHFSGYGVNQALGPVSRKSFSQRIVETSLKTLTTDTMWKGPVTLDFSKLEE
jgi:hypothetical protein